MFGKKNPFNDGADAVFWNQSRVPENAAVINNQLVSEINENLLAENNEYLVGQS